MSGRMFAHANLDAAYGEPDECKFAPEDEANLVTSVSSHQPNPHTVLHKPQLDLDVPNQYLYSTTPGHAHLSVEVDVPWDKYVKWLELSAELGIIEHGWVKAAKARGYTTLRRPHIKKTAAQKKKNGYNITPTYPEVQLNDPFSDSVFSLPNPL